MINFNKRKFRLISNSNVRDIGSATEFCFSQEGNTIFGNYNGGGVLRGSFLGRAVGNGSLEKHFHHLNQRGDLVTGKSIATSELLSNGKIRLKESWEYSPEVSGSAIFEEVICDSPKAEKWWSKIVRFTGALPIEHFSLVK